MGCRSVERISWRNNQKQTLSNTKSTCKTLTQSFLMHTAQGGSTLPTLENTKKNTLQHSLTQHKSIYMSRLWASSSENSPLRSLAATWILRWLLCRDPGGLFPVLVVWSLVHKLAFYDISPIWHSYLLGKEIECILIRLITHVVNILLGDWNISS
jgi:hypothetical protein